MWAGFARKRKERTVTTMTETTRGTFKTMAEVRAANKALGHHFFDRDAMRFFNSKINDTIYGGRYFVTSEQYDDKSPRRYTVRMVQDNGDIDTVGDFQAYGSLKAAQAIAQDLARELS